MEPLNLLRICTQATAIIWCIKKIDPAVIVPRPIIEMMPNLFVNADGSILQETRIARNCFRLCYIRIQLSSGTDRV